MSKSLNRTKKINEIKNSSFLHHIFIISIFLSISVILTACTKKTATDASSESSIQAPPISSEQSPVNSDNEDRSDECKMSREDAINEHWDEIKEYLTGTQEIEACSDQSNNCYDLDAYISSGKIDTLNFENGGFLKFSADFDENGSASDDDYRGNGWSFTLDMDSDFVTEAIETWASKNNCTIEDD